MSALSTPRHDYTTIFDLDDPTEAKLWLNGKLDHGKRKRFAEVGLLTPTLAKILLERNPDNRNIRPRRIAEITNDILADRYEMNGESVIISIEGLLNDGQNRCHAVINADKPIETFFAFGVTRDSRTTIDQGTARSGADFLKMDGGSNCKAANSIARALWFYEHDIIHEGSIAPTRTEAVRYYWDHRAEIDAAISVTANSAFTKDVALTPVAAAYVILMRHNKKEAEKFFSALLTGADLKVGSPILILIHGAKTFTKKRVRSGEKIELIMRTYNSWRSGESRKQICRSYGEYPKLVK